MVAVFFFVEVSCDESLISALELCHGVTVGGGCAMASVRAQLEFELARVVSWSHWLTAELADAASAALESRDVVRTHAHPRTPPPEILFAAVLRSIHRVVSTTRLSHHHLSSPNDTTIPPHASRWQHTL